MLTGAWALVAVATCGGVAVVGEEQAAYGEYAARHRVLPMPRSFSPPKQALANVIHNYFLPHYGPEAASVAAAACVAAAAFVVTAARPRSHLRALTARVA